MSPHELMGGESILRGELDRARRAIEGAFGSFHQRCQEELFDPLQRIVDDLREAHERLLRELPFDPSGTRRAGEGGEEEWEAIRRYGEGVGGSILEPVARQLGSARSVAGLGRLRRSLLDDLGAVARDASPTVLRAEPPELYASAPGDPLPWVVGKWMVRVRRAGRRILGSPPPRDQVVALRALLERHVGGRVQALIPHHLEAIHQSLARPLLSLEEALTRWAQSFPAAADRLDSPSYHVAAETKSVLASIEMPVEAAESRHVEEEDQKAPEPPAAGSEDDPDVAGQARELQGALEALEGSFALSQAMVEGFTAELAGAWNRLEGEVLRSGSFMAASPNAASPAATPGASPRDEVWEEWHREVRNRHRLNAGLWGLRSEWMVILDRLVEGVGREGLEFMLTRAGEAVVRLDELRPRMEAIFAGAEVRDAPRLAREVEELLETGSAVLERSLLTPLREEAWPARVRAVGDKAAEDLARAISRLPHGLRVHSAQEGVDGRVDPEASVVEIHLREITEQAMDVLRLESVRTSPGGFLESLERAREEAGEIGSILEFNLDSARKELADIDAMEESPTEVMADARSLTESGLTLTAQAVRDLRVRLVREWMPFVESICDLLLQPYGKIHERAGVTGSVEEQLLDLRARILESLRLRRKQAGDRTLLLTSSVRRALRRGGLHLLRLVRMGRAAVGTAPTSPEEAERTLEIIAGLPGFLASLPRAYQRLFSFEPVSDPGMLVGRDDELEWVRRRLQGRPSELSRPILLTGPTGVGRSSLLNVLRATVFEGLPVREIDIPERIRDEDALSALLASAFELPGDPPHDLAGLEDTILEAHAGAAPQVALVERMEHLFLRVPGGTDLLERMVCLQAATDSRILWISTMGQIAWKQVSTQELRVRGLLDVRSLGPVDRVGMEEVIMGRHRRSGLPARFEEPVDPNPILRRRLRRARDDRERQELLREDFFDRLYRVSDSSIPMAIFLWLRSADFGDGDGTAHIHPVESLRIGNLHQDLDVSLFFSLKAFLEHGSLTLEEHSEIFRVSQDESFQIFTGLRGRMLLEPLAAGKRSRSDVVPSVEEGRSYRVPPLLTQTVIQHLKNRNIVH